MDFQILPFTLLKSRGSSSNILLRIETRRKTMRITILCPQGLLVLSISSLVLPHLITETSSLAAARTLQSVHPVSISALDHKLDEENGQDHITPERSLPPLKEEHLSASRQGATSKSTIEIVIFSNTSSFIQQTLSTNSPTASSIATSSSFPSPSIKTTQMNTRQRTGKASKTVVIGSVVGAACGIAALVGAGYGVWRCERRVVDEENGE